jgi:hypothetical protein
MARSIPGPRQPVSVLQEGDEGTDIQKLSLAFQIRQSHYDGIWEEQKHFTWIISIILSAQAVVLAGTSIRPHDKLTIVLIASAVGVLMALIAFRVQRLEAIYFCQANERFAQAYHDVYPNSPEPFYSRQPNKPIWRLITFALRGKAGVRDNFQFMFVAFAVLFLFVAGYAVATL